MIFADVKGFSKLTDEEMPRFTERVLGGFALTLSRYSASIQHQNTWGDALYVVLDDAVEAAACALELQIAMGAIDLEGEWSPVPSCTAPRRARRTGLPDLGSGSR